MRRVQAGVFTLFCLLAGSRWLADTAWPSGLPVLEEQSLHHALICATACAFLFVRVRSTKVLPQQWQRVAAAGLLLLGLPAVLETAVSSFFSYHGASLFGLTPLCIAVAAGAAGSGAAGLSGGRAMMVPALTGFAGTVLLLPFQIPLTLREGLLFAALCVGILSSAVGSVFLHPLLRGWAVVPALAAVCGANAIVFGLVAEVTRGVVTDMSLLPVELIRCGLLDLPYLVLLLWLLREVDPVRLSSRFLVVPLVSAVEGMVVLRQGIDARTATGLLLVAVGGGALLLWRADEDGPAGLNLG